VGAALARCEMRIVCLSIFLGCLDQRPRTPSRHEGGFRQDMLKRTILLAIDQAIERGIVGERRMIIHWVPGTEL